MCCLRVWFEAKGFKVSGFRFWVAGGNARAMRKACVRTISGMLSSSTS